jgi:signal peptidase I
VVFRYPNDPKEYFLKRVIGLPGETVKISGGKVIVYNAENPEGLQLNESYLPSGVTIQGEKTVTVTDNQYFVLGDNRDNSFDSRRFGSIDESLIVGRAWVRGWPFSRMQTFSTPEFK